MAKRLPLESWYPAAERALTARMITLPGGERARVVEGGPPDAEPLVFLHGWGCSAYTWRRVLGALVARDARVVAFDLRGHGMSDKPLDAAAYSCDAMRRFAIDALDAMRLDAVALVGHSLGGAVAIDVARTVPDRVRTLTLLAPVGLAPVRMIGLASTLTPDFTRPLVRHLPPRWTIPVVLRLVHGRAGTRQARDVDEYWAPTAFPEFSLAMRLLLRHYRWSPRSDEELRAVTAGVSVILGGRDRLLNVGVARARARQFWPTATELSTNAGHVLAEEIPERVIELLSRPGVHAMP